MAAEIFDVVVLGAGPAGENVADYAIRGSARSALLVERELVGGECSYYACMPSKALLRPLEVRAAAEHLQGLPDRLELDVPALLARRDSWVAGYDDSGQAQWARGAGIDVARGTGRITGERRVFIDGADSARDVVARHAVVVATGSRPVVPRLFADLHPWTSRDATGIVEVPDSIAVVGGGVVAVEACAWLAALGASVTLLVRGPRVLGRCEPFASELVAEGLGRLGVDVRLGAQVDSAARLDGADTGLGRVHGGPVRLEVDGRVQEFAEVLVATGRTPATADIGLESVGLTAAEFSDPSARPDWLYAVGDAGGEAPLTHWGKYRARLVGEEIAARAEGRPVPDAPAGVPVPQVVFTDPQVASVGLTEADAVARGIATQCVQVPLTSAAGFGLLRDDASGQAKLVFEAGTDRLLGATFAGQEVAELVHAATVAIVGRLTAGQLWHAVPSYPTASEVWLRLLEACRAR
ncbi:MAG: NAD(P)/FAD-dependent oxidoreductase [Propionicimonas sp.]|uniref:dihydrolipoyl dehydrogenase family protein n=1 Tax=Propionicimonas sp. TaxID=1955623 RepID=UPI003D13F635